MASRLLKLGGNLRPLSCRFKSSHEADFRAAIAGAPPTHVTKLDNGVRVGVAEFNSPVASVGIYVNVGSRYEDANNNGAANLLKRLHLQGTAKKARNDFHKEIGNTGALLHINTSREQTSITATCIPKHVPKVVEILADALQNPRLDEADIELSRAAAKFELKNTQDDLEAVTFDYLHATAFQGTSLSQTIFGPTTNIEEITKKTLEDYIGTHYKGCRTVLAGAGDVSAKELTSLAEKNLGKLDNTFDGNPPDLPPCRFTSSDIRDRDDSLPLANVAFAVEGAGANSPDRVPLLIAAQIIGAWDRTQNAGIHHSCPLAADSAKEGLCHGYRAFSINYSNTGLWGVYGAAERMTVRDFTERALLYVGRLSFDVTENDVQRAQKQILANIFRSLDGPTNVANEIGRQILLHGRRMTLQEAVSEVESVTAEQVQNVARKCIYGRSPAVAAVGPIEGVLDLTRICSSMKWWTV